MPVFYSYWLAMTYVCRLHLGHIEGALPEIIKDMISVAEDRYVLEVEVWIYSA